MSTILTTELEHFFVAGINYKKTDVSIRGKFAINNEEYDLLLKKASADKLTELFILSTCNRTEIYGIANNAEDLINLLCSETAGDIKTFRELAYIKRGKKAIEHLFAVGAGLDSQILGDYEIVSQLKQAVKFAKERNLIGTFLERLINSVLRSSKYIKSNTQLSSGIVSVSFAAVQFLRNQVNNIKDKNILLIGAGKIGRNTCKHLVALSEVPIVTIINRTDDTAFELAKSMDIRYAVYKELEKQIDIADIILVSTNSKTPFILKKDIKGNKQKILIDLSIPNNIDPSVAEFSNITLINVDELSRQKDETLQKRKAEVPYAKDIIHQHSRDFIEWHEMRRHVSVLKAVKQKLIDIQSDDLFYNTYYSPLDTVSATANSHAIQKVIDMMAVKLRNNNTKGCQYIEAINDYIATGNNS
jgi:glutamyl-tRNA reductase